MPIPSPTESEEKNTFISRCMADQVMLKEYPEQKVRSGVCYTAWKQAKEKNMDDSLEMEIMSVGTWNNTEFTKQDLEDMARNFKELKEVIKPYIKLGHVPKQGQPSNGWIQDLKVKGDKLIAFVTDIPKILMDAIKAKRYKRVSSEVYMGFTNNKKRYGKVLYAVALLGAQTPAVRNLRDLTAYLEQNADTDGNGPLLRCEDLLTFEIDFEPEGLNINKDKEKELMENKEFEAKMLEFSAKLDALTKENASLKATNQTLEKEKSEREVQLFEEKKTRAKEDFAAYCEDQVKEGKLLPAQRDILIGQENFSAEGDINITLDQFKAFQDLTGRILDKEEKAKEDSKQETFSNVQEEVDRKIKTYMREHKVAYTEAMDAIFTADKDLANRYITQPISIGSVDEE